MNLPVHLLSRSQVLAEATHLIDSHRAHLAITVNSLLALELEKDPSLVKICEQAALCIPDSYGLVWAAKRLSQPAPDLYPGIELADDLCGVCEIHSWPVYLLGATSGVASEAAKELSRRYPYLHIAGMRDGFFQPSDEAAIIADIARSRSKLVLVALGSPRQEKWIWEHLNVLPPALYVGVGGSFDVWSGRVERAPRFFRKRGLEWMYRLLRQPARANRIALLPKFAFKVLRQSFRGN